MNRPLHCLAPSLAALALACGCAHGSDALERTTTSTTTTTSAQMEAPRTPRAPRIPDVYVLDVRDDVPLDRWIERYPDASRELADWMRQYPSAAAKMSQWERVHPIRMKALVDWAVAHRFEPIEAFLFERSGWYDFTSIFEREPNAVPDLLDWARRSPNAAEELVTHPGGVAWAHGHTEAMTPRGHAPQAPAHVAER